MYVFELLLGYSIVCVLLCCVLLRCIFLLVVSLLYSALLAWWIYTYTSPILINFVAMNIFRGRPVPGSRVRVHGSGGAGALGKSFEGRTPRDRGR